MNIPEQVNALLSCYTLHHHAIGVSLEYDSINEMVLLGLACNMLNFGVVV
jgi:hypothetical protein